MKVFLITAYKSDRDYKSKKKLIQSVFDKYELELLLAEDKNNLESLSAENTVELFKSADYFIADISFERPSCYYEIGFLQALDKKLFLISKKGELIHQLLNKNTIEFYSNTDEYKLLIEKISKRIAS